MSQRVLRYHFVKTRKPHVCFGCGRSFETGSQMVSACTADTGYIDSFYFCETCDKIICNMDDNDDFAFGDLYQDAIELESKNCNNIMNNK